jgi:vancomycin permeability regulator SanA
LNIPKRIAIAAIALVAALPLAVEGLDWAASTAPSFSDRAGLAPTAHCAVLVLGYPAQSDGSPDPVQLDRVEWGAAVYRGLNCERFVISGGAAHNAFVEAEVMAGAARRIGIPAAQLVLEGRATNTWENIRYSLPSLAGADAIYLVSEGLHARRARRYLCRQRADLCARAYAVATYRPLHRFDWKAGAVAHEVLSYVRDIVQFGAPLMDPPAPPAPRDPGPADPTDRGASSG